MRLYISNMRVAALMTDDAPLSDNCIEAPENFDFDKFDKYELLDGVLTLPVEPVSEKIEALWQAADRYVTGYISGVAIGILTIGVVQEKPKALAVTAWSSSIWAEYYVRKDMITAGSEVSHDFSSFGPIPYSVPELQEEIGM